MPKAISILKLPLVKLFHLSLIFIQELYLRIDRMFAEMHFSWDFNRLAL